MLKRLLVGLLLGLVIGGAIAAALIKGLAMNVFADGAGGAALAYLFAAVTGVVIGLVAGKPIWASGGQIEAGLKAFFGALLGAGAMFALRRFVTTPIDLSALGAGSGAIGSLPAITLPIIAGVLGGFYEVDNTPEPDKKDDAKDSKAGAKASSKVRVADKDEDEDDAVEEAPRRAKK